MTIYKQDGSDEITEGVHLSPTISVFENEAIFEFYGAVQVRVGMDRAELVNTIQKFTNALSLLIK